VDADIPLYLGGSGRGVEKSDPSGTTPYLFRNYVPGDPYKHIDWKKTAQSGGLVTRVFSDEGTRDVTIHVPANASERSISRAASLIVHFARKGTPISLQGPGLNVGPGYGRDFVRKLLTILARWQHDPQAVSEQDGSERVIVDINGSAELSWEDGGQTHETR
jgi:uncharacterized protein (DUF58 family)